MEFWFFLGKVAHVTQVKLATTHTNSHSQMPLLFLLSLLRIPSVVFMINGKFSLAARNNCKVKLARFKPLGSKLPKFGQWSSFNETNRARDFAACKPQHLERNSNELVKFSSELKSSGTWIVLTRWSDITPNKSAISPVKNPILLIGRHLSSWLAPLTTSDANYNSNSATRYLRHWNIIIIIPLELVRSNE